MIKSEFIEKLIELGIKENVSNDDYAKIEYVYTYHPSISETDGITQIAYLYSVFGIRIILDMIPTAQKAQQYENNIMKARNKLDALTNYYDAFCHGEDIERG